MVASDVVSTSVVELVVEVVVVVVGVVVIVVVVLVVVVVVVLVLLVVVVGNVAILGLTYYSFILYYKIDSTVHCQSVGYYLKLLIYLCYWAQRSHQIVYLLSGLVKTMQEIEE